jgi:uncharacterized protein (TIGR03083 family)
MTSDSDATLADRGIAALRANHDRLAALIATLTPADLTRPSGASEWQVAQVLSHLGSGAEISLAGLRAAMGTGSAQPDDFNQSVWDRWNAMAPEEQATSFLLADEALVATYESLTPDQRESMPIPVVFMPVPLSVAAMAGLRLNEAAQHSWDVRVAFDPDAEVADLEAQLLAELFSGELGFLLGFIGRADALANPATVQLEGDGFSIVIGETVSLTKGDSGATATFTGGLPAAVRLLGGRLTALHTPSGIDVTGNVTLDQLRQVFPGT